MNHLQLGGVALLLAVTLLAMAPAAQAQFGGPAPPAAATPAAPSAAPARPFDVASQLYEEGKQAEALVTLRQLAEARAVVEPQLSGAELIRADALVGEYKARLAKK